MASIPHSAGGVRALDGCHAARRLHTGRVIGLPPQRVRVATQAIDVCCVSGNWLTLGVEAGCNPVEY